MDLEDVGAIEVGGVTAGDGKKILLGLGLLFMHYERGVRTGTKMCILHLWGVVQVRLSLSSMILESSDSGQQTFMDDASLLNFNLLRSNRRVTVHQPNTDVVPQSRA